MKVNTDSVLLGSWIDAKGEKSILDIGTGTGILALMMAQKCSGSVTAIEIDELASKDAMNNFSGCKWNERITLLTADFRDEKIFANQKFDLIVSNPPFFINSEKSSDTRKMTARHTDSLPHEILLCRVKELLTDDGSFSLVLPYEVYTDFIRKARLQSLHPNEILYVRPTENKSPNRCLLKFSFRDSEVVKNEISIRTNNQYSSEYKELTKEFYLAF